MNTSRNAKIIDLWIQGHQPAAIRKMMNLSRSTIIGVINRHKKKNGHLPQRRETPPQAPQNPVGAPKRLLDLDYDDCRYIVHYWGATALFCAKPATRGSYCAEHAEICSKKHEWTPKPKRKPVGKYTRRIHG